MPEDGPSPGAVRALVKLCESHNVDSQSVDHVFSLMRTSLQQFFFRQRWVRKARGILSILGFRKRLGRDHFDEHLGEETKRYESLQQQKDSVMKSRIELLEKYHSFVRFLVQSYIFIAVTVRCCYEIPRSFPVFLIETLIVDAPIFVTIIKRCYPLRDRGGVVTYKSEDALDYIKSIWFFYDIATLLPLDFIGILLGSSCTIAFNKCAFIAPYWQLNRLLFCKSMLNAMAEFLEKRMLQVSFHPYLARVVNAFVTFLFTVHLIACLVGLLFLRRPDEFEILPGNTHEYKTNAFTLYVAAADWASKNLVGLNRGTPFPLDTLELLMAFGTSLVGVSLFAILLAVIANYVARSTPLAEFQNQIDEVIFTMRYKKYPKELLMDTLAFMRHNFDSRTHMLTHHQVLGQCTEDLIDKIKTVEGLNILQRVPLFAPHCSNLSFVVETAKLLTPVVHPPHHVLFQRGDAGDAMYFVMLGSLGVVADDDINDVKFRMGRGGFVGEIALMMDGPRTATVVSLESFTNLMKLPKRGFQELSTRYPQVFQVMQETARERFLAMHKHLFEAVEPSMAKRNSFREVTNFALEERKAEVAHNEQMANAVDDDMVTS